MCEALKEHGNVTTLDVSATNLGLASQNDIDHVMAFTIAAPYVHHLDMSGNCISHMGFELISAALQHPETDLKTLDISHNAATVVVMPRRKRLNKVVPTRVALEEPPKVVVKDGTECTHEDLPNFNPVVLLCEALAHNETLREVRLASSCIDYAADCALLNSLLVNKTLRSLDLSNNPHGIQGLRAILRMMLTPGQTLECCKICDFHEGAFGPGDVQLDFGAPGGLYDLELGHPQHRAVLRWLLRVAEQHGVSPPDKALADMQWHGFQGNAGAKPFTETKKHGWSIVKGGRLHFKFDAPLELEKQGSASAAVTRWLLTRRLSVNLKRFMLFLAMFDSLKSMEQKTMLIKAATDTLLFKTCHMSKLLQACPNIADITTRSLIGHLFDTDYLLLFDLMGRYRDVARVFRKDARAVYFFNAINPTHRYKLNLTNPMDHSVATRLHVINNYELLVAQRLKRPDLSQHGNLEGARNVAWQSEWESEVVHQPESFLHWAVPEYGILTLDYVCAAMQRQPATATESLMSGILRTIAQSECSHEDTVSALRSISWQLVFAPAQVASLCSAFPKPQAQNALPDGRYGRTDFKMLMPVSDGPVLPVLSAFQFKFWKYRVEAFISLFSRCCDPPMLCTPECLYNNDVFTADCVEEVCQRLGRIRTFDALNCNVPLEQFSAAVAVSPNTRLARTLKFLKDVQEAENTGQHLDLLERGPQQLGRSHEFDLSIYEDRVCAKFVLQLASGEAGESLKDCYWSLQDHNRVKEGDFEIPKEWTKQVPSEGKLQVMYVSEKPGSIDYDARRHLAETLFGWEKIV
jgi:hypothetical protein